MQNLARYTKAIAALVAAIATSLLGIFGPDTATGHTLTVIVAVAGVLAVYQFENADDPSEVGGQ